MDYEKLVNSAAIKALFEIRKVVQNNELDDFEVVERIVCIFEKYNINEMCIRDRYIQVETVPGVG